MKRSATRRTAVAAVEFAVVAPIFMMMVFGIVEFGRMMMVQQTLINASREGARMAVMESATADSVVATVQDYLAGAAVDVSGGSVKVTPDPSAATNNEKVTVAISVPFSDVSWIPPFFYDGPLKASTTMRSERLN
ncbi:MAG: pilus assembly protein [Pirellulaceae bacterium]|nr:pilus assembly protein [Pirellulaceae bacterium]